MPLLEFNPGLIIALPPRGTEVVRRTESWRETLQLAQHELPEDLTGCVLDLTVRAAPEHATVIFYARTPSLYLSISDSPASGLFTIDVPQQIVAAWPAMTLWYSLRKLKDGVPRERLRGPLIVEPGLPGI